jgi:hypothetical protein
MSERFSIRRPSGHSDSFAARKFISGSASSAKSAGSDAAPMARRSGAERMTIYRIMRRHGL